MMTAPKIWVPKAKILEPRQAIPLAIRMAGRFKMEAIRPDGRVRLLADWFPNLITDAGLNVIGTSTSWLNACRVGTGAGTPNVADTAMGSFVAGTTNSTAFVQAINATPPYHGRNTKTWQFAAGAAAGNLAEVGVATQAAVGGTLFSRALILDGDGDPTTITVLSDEILQVTYQFQCIAPTTDVSATITISGIDYDIVTRAANAATQGDWCLGSASGVTGGPSNCSVHSGTIGAITASPSGTTSFASNTTLASYSNNSLQRDATFDWNLASANFGGTGIRAMSFLLGSNTSAFGKMQVSFAQDASPSDGILKTSSQVLALTCRHVWARGTAI